MVTAGSVLVASTFATASPAAAAVTCASPTWKAQFYANTTFSGTPKLTACDSVIDEKYGTGDPAGVTLPRDNFSVRWTMSRNFGSGGPFSFAAEAQDGVRVYVDGIRKVDMWKNVSSTQKKTVNVTIPSGSHTIRVDFVTWTGSANVKFSYGPRTPSTVDKVKPLAPTGTSVAYSTSTLKATVRWSKNAEIDLAGYRIYRRLAGASEYKLVSGSSLLTGTSFTDTPPATGQSFYYEVRAIDKAGNISTGSTDQKAVTLDRTIPAAPKGVDANWAIGPVSQVQLSWPANTEPDLAGYRIHRSTVRPVVVTAANRVSGSAPLTSSWYTETPPPTGADYHYVVTAVDTNGNESAPSGTASFSTFDKTAPANQAVQLQGTGGEAGVTLSWAHSQTPSPDFAGYTIWRSTKPRSSGARGTAIWNGVLNTTYTDASAVPGITYYYWLDACDRSYNCAAPSAEAQVVFAADTTPPGPVTGLTAQSRENGVQLHWDRSTAADGDQYEVYRGRLVDGQWAYTLIFTTGRMVDFPSLQYLDRTLPDGESARYSVVAVDRWGNKRAPHEAAVTPEFTELDVRPTVAPAPGGVITDLQVTDYGWVRWDLTADANEQGARTSGFHVYRWNRAEGVFERLTAEPVPYDPADTSLVEYDDYSMPQGTTTFYRVTAMYEDGTESPASETYSVAW
ncbi:hypothetical protein GT042_08445 [Streptomyces sp. SID3212]|nr:PA14 domain-containing protein [Streptomyces sp. SID3212]MYV52528.1 hypothetical protein [Streptomyces sp. SID3212]